MNDDSLPAVSAVPPGFVSSLSAGQVPQPRLGGERRRARTGMLAAAAALAILVISGLSVALINATRAPSPQTASSPPHSTPAGGSGKARSSPAIAPPADFKVCVYPVSGCTGYQSQYMRTEPSRIVTSGDGSGFVDNISWTSWGTPTARGLGVLEIDNCTPSCAAGAYTGYRAAVTLTHLIAYGSGTKAYTKIVVSAPGSPYTPRPFTTGLVP